MIGCFESSASPSDRRANAGSHSLRTPLQREHTTARRFRRAAWPTTTEVIGARAVAGGTRNTHSSDQTAFRLCGSVHTWHRRFAYRETVHPPRCGDCTSVLQASAGRSPQPLAHRSAGGVSRRAEARLLTMPTASSAPAFMYSCVEYRYLSICSAAQSRAADNCRRCCSGRRLSHARQPRPEWFEPDL